MVSPVGSPSQCQVIGGPLSVGCSCLLTGEETSPTRLPGLATPRGRTCWPGLKIGSMDEPLTRLAVAYPQTAPGQRASGQVTATTTRKNGIAVMVVVRQSPPPTGCQHLPTYQCWV